MIKNRFMAYGLASLMMISTAFTSYAAGPGGDIQMQGGPGGEMQGGPGGKMQEMPGMNQDDDNNRSPAPPHDNQQSSGDDQDNNQPPAPPQDNQQSSGDDQDNNRPPEPPKGDFDIVSSFEEKAEGVTDESTKSEITALIEAFKNALDEEKSLLDDETSEKADIDEAREAVSAARKELMDALKAAGIDVSSLELPADRGPEGRRMINNGQVNRETV